MDGGDRVERTRYRNNSRMLIRGRYSGISKLPSNLRGWWDMRTNSASEGGVIYDRTGHGFNGTIAGSPSFSGGYMQFDGANDKVTVANHADLIIGTNDFQIHVWAKPAKAADQGDNAVMVGKGTYNANGGWLLNFGKATTAYEILGDNSVSGDAIYINDVAPNYMPDPPVLGLYSAVRSGVVCRLYHNSVFRKADSSSSANLADTNSLIIGNEIGAFWYKGEIRSVLFSIGSKSFARAEKERQDWYRGARHGRY